MLFCYMADNLGHLLLLLWAIGCFDCSWKVDIHIICWGLEQQKGKRQYDILSNNIEDIFINRKKIRLSSVKVIEHLVLLYVRGSTSNSRCSKVLRYLILQDFSDTTGFSCATVEMLEDLLNLFSRNNRKRTKGQIVLIHRMA